MKSLPQEKCAIHERLVRLEKQNQHYKQYAIFLLIAVLSLFLIGAKAGLKDGHFRQITAEKITIVDGNGHELIQIGFENDKTGIRIFNMAGKKVIGIGTTLDDRGSGILISDKQGRPRFGLGMDMGLPSFAMVDEKGKKIMAMGGDERGYGLVIMDENEVERAGIGFNKGNAGIMLYDDKGQYVRGMIGGANGTNYSSYVDENGKEIIVR